MLMTANTNAAHQLDVLMLNILFASYSWFFVACGPFSHARRQRRRRFSGQWRCYRIQILYAVNIHSSCVPPVSGERGQLIFFAAPD